MSKKSLKKISFEKKKKKKNIIGCLEMAALCCALSQRALASNSWMNLRTVQQDSNNNNNNSGGGGHTNNNQNSLFGTVTRREMEIYFDQALKTYTEINDIRRGTRSCMWAWMSHCCLGHSFQTDMISQILLRPSERENKHRSAMLLEQAAFAYLRAGPNRAPMLRKYAFHLILAAHLYRECDQKEHSIRCYSRAMMVYAERNWAHIEDHINYNLGWFFFCFVLSLFYVCER